MTICSPKSFTVTTLGFKKDCQTDEWTIQSPDLLARSTSLGKQKQKIERKWFDQEKKPENMAAKQIKKMLSPQKRKNV